MNTLSRETTLSKLILLPSEKGSSLKGKNLLPLGANSILLEKTSFQKRICVQESKPEAIKSCLPCQKMAENVSSAAASLVGMRKIVAQRKKRVLISICNVNIEDPEQPVNPGSLLMAFSVRLFVLQYPLSLSSCTEDPTQTVLAELVHYCSKMT